MAQTFDIFANFNIAPGGYWLIIFYGVNKKNRIISVFSILSYCTTSCFPFKNEC